jgi:uncharacterized protein YjbI with pentapeptide repeats
MSRDDPEVEAPGWPTCIADGCLGIRVEGDQACLAHLTSEARQAVLDALAPGAEVNLQGTLIDSELLSAVLARLHDKDGSLRFGPSSFERAQFEDDTEFKGVLFDGATSFEKATFLKCANFDGAKFTSTAWFKESHFVGDASFRGLLTSPEWLHGARFDKAVFEGKVDFEKAQLLSTAWFVRVHFCKYASFKAAQFTGSVKFESVQFSDEARFDEARFSGVISFNGCRFQAVWFSKARFSSTTIFGVSFRARFDGQATFDGAEFLGSVSFANVTFANHASFQGVNFAGHAGFDDTAFPWGAKFIEAKFNKGARFHRAQFNGLAYFTGAEFSGDRWFEETEFFLEGDAAVEHRDVKTQFERARFTEAGKFGPLLTVNPLVLDDATFEDITQIAVTGSEISCLRVSFNEQLIFRLRFADIVLDGTNFAKPAVFAFVGDELLDERRMRQEGQSSKPRILSLRQVDASTLTLMDLDLSACLFQDASNLDKLRIQGPPAFAPSPGPWRLRVGRRCIPVWQRWSRRQTLAEEHHWRAPQPTSATPPIPSAQPRLIKPGWHSPTTVTPPFVHERTHQQARRLQPDHLAVIYRTLRKAEEDTKNEPGAADFYYGEMEMRRNAEGISWAERLILRLYWLISGYALRAWRSIATLAAIILLGAVAFAFWGFPAPEATFRPVGINVNGSVIYQREPADLTSGIEQLPDAIRFSAQSATALLRGPDRTLTPLGEWIEILLRFLGPLLLGLAVLSVRGRVKR